MRFGKFPLNLKVLISFDEKFLKVKPFEISVLVGRGMVSARLMDLGFILMRAVHSDWRCGGTSESDNISIFMLRALQVLHID